MNKLILKIVIFNISMIKIDNYEKYNFIYVF